MWTPGLCDLDQGRGEGLLLSRRQETSRALLFTSEHCVYDTFTPQKMPLKVLLKV